MTKTRKPAARHWCLWRVSADVDCGRPAGVSRVRTGRRLLPGDRRVGIGRGRLGGSGVPRARGVRTESAEDHVVYGIAAAPLGFILGSWRDGLLPGAMQDGSQRRRMVHGCCWALMGAHRYSRFGVDEHRLDGVVAALIDAEKTRHGVVW